MITVYSRYINCLYFCIYNAGHLNQHNCLLAVFKPKKAPLGALFVLAVKFIFKAQDIYCFFICRVAPK